MTLSKSQKHTVTSLAIIGILTLLAYFIVRQGGDLSASMIVFLTLIAGVGVGASLLLLRLTNVIKHPNSLFYNYFGTLNITLALVQVTVLLISQQPYNQLLLIFLNLTIGLAILIDIYRNKSSIYNSR